MTEPYLIDENTFDRDISDYYKCVNSLSALKETVAALIESNVNQHAGFSAAKRVIKAFQDNLERISIIQTNRENAVDDVEDLLRRSQIPPGLDKVITSDGPLDGGFMDSIESLEGLLQASDRLKQKGYIIGFEMERELGPLVDTACQRIVSKCVDLLTVHRNTSTDWKQLQQLNLLPQARLFQFVEEFRPALGASFVSKYCEISSAQYYAATKMALASKLSSHAKRPLQGEPLIGQQSAVFKKDSVLSDGLSRTQSQPSSPTFSESLEELPRSLGQMLIGFVQGEEAFFKEFSGPAYQRHKPQLSKILQKSQTRLIKDLREHLHTHTGSALAALKMMALSSVLEIEVASITDLPAPLQWINELQEVVFEEFKRHLRKHIVSLSSYSDLKTKLTSTELHHHHVARRFAEFMRQALSLTKAFQRPWEMLQVELKKLEHVFYSWMLKVGAHVRDQNEMLAFQINNYHLVLEQCEDVAGVDFTATLSFKYESQLSKLVHHSLQHYLGDLQKLAVQGSNLSLLNANDINTNIATSIRAIARRIKERAFLDYSNVLVGEEFRVRFRDAVIGLYSDYMDVYDASFGKCQLTEQDVPLVALNKIRAILEVELHLTVQ